LRKLSDGLEDGQEDIMLFPGTELRSLDLLVRKPTKLHRLTIILCLKRRLLFGKPNCVCPQVKRWRYPPIQWLCRLAPSIRNNRVPPNGNEKKASFRDFVFRSEC
jgi:hypothetical protein